MPFQMGSSVMSLILAGCVLLLALLAGIVFDGATARRSQKPRRDIPTLDAW
jgi:hypothetical protein